jgi:hypothetical protein
MKPESWPPLLPGAVWLGPVPAVDAAVISGGSDDVSVVANRVGLKRREEA